MSAIQCEIYFKNITGEKLILKGKKDIHGVFNTDPPAEIADNSVGFWENGSDGFMTGAEAIVEYKTAGGVSFILHYTNPYVGPTWETHGINPVTGQYGLDGNAGPSHDGRADYNFRAYKK